ncbi:MAG: NAD-dependent dihydropyrimidine dehydrogenase subunit PreA [Ruminococcus sp.]
MNYDNIILKTESSRCLLCSDAPCTKACKNGIPVDKIIRSVNFDNVNGARFMLDNKSCSDCIDGDCVSVCSRENFDSPVNVEKIVSLLSNFDYVKPKEVDLSVDLCGVKCENPFFLSSSVVGSNYEMVAKAFDIGWAGVAFKTIGMFVPNEVSPRFSELEKEDTSFIGFKNIEQISTHTLEENLNFFRQLKKNYPKKVIIASIMGRNQEEWTKLASLCEEYGADIIECNFSCPQMVGEGLGSDVGINPKLVAEYIRAVKKGTKLPVLAKMTPNITSMLPPAVASVEAGADGLAAINTIKSIMNVDLNSFASAPDVEGYSAVGGYSGKAVKPIALRFINEMASFKKLENIPISGMGGIETWRDAAEFISLGCSTVQVTTSVMQYGYRIIEDLIDGLKRYMSDMGFNSVYDFIGKANKKIKSADDLDRSYICFPKFDKEKCVGCGRCFVSCYDGGHQAIKLNDDRKPILYAKKCVGCHLCKIVCPVGAISAGKKINKSNLI